MTTYTDDFNRANGAVGNAPTAVPYDGSGSWSIDTNAVKSTGGVHDTLVFDAGGVDLDISCSPLEAPSPGEAVGLTIRWSDDTHWVAVTVSVGDGGPDAIHLIYDDAGLSGIDSNDITFTPGAELRAVVSGNTIDCYYDGSLLLSGEDITGLGGGSFHGLHSDGSTARIDDLSLDVTSLPVGSFEATILVGGSITTGPPPPVITLDLSGAVRDPVAFPAVLDVDDGPPSPLTISVFDRSDLNTPLAVLDQTFGRTFLDQLCEVGSGQFNIDNTDPDYSLLVGNEKVIGWDIYGYRVFASLARTRQRTSLNENEEHDEVTAVSGPGHLSIFDEDRIYPSRGVNRLPVEDDRSFSWPSPVYDDSGWRTATVMQSVAAANAGPPTGWPVIPFGGDSGIAFESTDIIGPSVGSHTDAPVGFCYFRGHVTLVDTARYIVYVAADNIVDFYIDGQLFAHGEDFTHVISIPLDLDSGDHVFAAVVQNIPGGTGLPNPLGLAVSWWEASPSNQPLTFVGGSSDDWLIVEYPPTPPGMTPGEVIRICLDEAQARGELLEVTLDFTDETTTSGDPWPIVTDISTKVGTDFLSFLREMSGTYIDFWMSPASFTLSAWNIGGKGIVRPEIVFPWPEADDPNSSPLTELIHTTEALTANVLLVRWGNSSGGAGGWVEVGAPADGDTKRVGLLGLGAAFSKEQAVTIALEQLAKYGQIREAIQPSYDVVRFLDDGTPDLTLVPGLGYGTGDTITLPAEDESPTSERVQAVTIEENDEGILSCSLDVKDVFLDAEQRWEQQIKRLGEGTMRGDSKVATPISAIGTVGPTCCPQIPTSGPG